MCTDPKRSAHRARHKFFGIFRHRVFGRDYESRPAGDFNDRRPRLLARAAQAEIAEELSVSLVSEPPAPFFHREDYDPDTHYQERIGNRIAEHLEERRAEELGIIASPLAA